jgi:hypothetical protein
VKKINCIFCGEYRQKAKEHIWPQWLQLNLFGSLQENFLSMNSNLMSPEKPKSRQTAGSSLVYGKVCSICNNGWMSRLEGRFKMFFEKLQADYNYLHQISKKERFDVSLWALKTSMMINSAGDYRQVIPFELYKHLEKSKTLPKNVKVDLTYINSDKELSWEQSNIYGSINKLSLSKAEISRDLKENSFVTSLQVERLGIKVSYYKNAKERNIKLPKPDNSKALRIWPYEKDSNFSLDNCGYGSLFSFHCETLVKNIH